MVELIKNGANYEHHEVPAFSFIEEMIMFVCHTSVFKNHHLSAFSTRNFNIEVNQEYLPEPEFIEFLLKFDYADASCVSFFDSPVMKSEFTQFACGATMITSIAVSPCISAMMAMARSTSD